MKKNLKYIGVMCLVVFFLEMLGRVVLGSNYYRFHDCGFNPFDAGELLSHREFVDIGKKEIPFWVKTNNLGLRDTEATSWKHNEKGIRIAAIGDSMTYGACVNNQDTWPNQLEQNLSKRLSLDVNVCNLGFVGYTMEDEFFVLQDKGISLDPDLILIGFYANDIVDFDAAYRSIFRRAKIDKSLLSRLKFETKVWLKKSSVFCSMLWLRSQITLYLYKHKRASRADTQDTIAVNELEKNVSPDYIQQYVAYLRKTVALAKKHNKPIMWVFFPHFSEIAADQHYYQVPKQAIKKELDLLQVPYLDLLPYLREAGDKDVLYLLPHEWHMSRYGYIMSARLISEFLEKHKQLWQMGREA